MITLAPGADHSPRFLARLAKVEKATAMTGHTCEGTLAGALRCKKCLGRKVTVDLPAYRPQAITSAESYAKLLAEYTGEAGARRAEERARYEEEGKRTCACGHGFHSHAKPCGDDHTECHARNGYGWCSCLEFRDAQTHPAIAQDYAERKARANRAEIARLRSGVA